MSGTTSITKLILTRITRPASQTLTTRTAATLPLSNHTMPSIRPYSTSNTPIAFTYRLAAASIPKRRAPRPPKSGHDFWDFTSTQPSPSPPYLTSTKTASGEDAFFAATIGGSHHKVAFGLADGVGGWQDQGIDPSHFSQTLCRVMAETAHRGGARSAQPGWLLQTAYDAVQKDDSIEAGGSTASLAVVNVDGVMEAANLGDSGFIVFGPGRVVFRSGIQTHAFNTPYQLSKYPPRMRAQNSIFGGGEPISETPKQADLTSHNLKHGDVALFATDGVWDNLSAQDSLAIVTRVMEEEGYWFKSHNFPGAETMLNANMIRKLPRTVEDAHAGTYLAGKLASAVMKEAKIAGLDRRRDGPFAKEVKRYYPHEAWAGGKPDDIAVVVCIAVQDGDGSDAVKAKL